MPTKKVTEQELDIYPEDPFQLIDYLVKSIQTESWRVRTGIVNKLMGKVLGVQIDDWRRVEILDHSPILQSVMERSHYDKVIKRLADLALKEIETKAEKLEQEIVDKVVRRVTDKLTYELEEDLKSKCLERYQPLLQEEVEARLKQTFVHWDAFNKIQRGAAKQNNTAD